MTYGNRSKHGNARQACPTLARGASPKMEFQMVKEFFEHTAQGSSSQYLEVP